MAKKPADDRRTAVYLVRHTFVIGFFARDLTFTIMGWPFSFWVASQGSLIVYMLIIWYYARTMNRMDTEYGVAEEED